MYDEPHRDGVAGPGLHRRGMVGERDGAEHVGGEPLLSVLVLAGLLPEGRRGLLTKGPPEISCLSLNRSYGAK